MINFWKSLGKVAIAAASLLTAQQTMAAGTAADTTVSNTVTVNYSISSTPQTAVQSTVTFKVDRKIDVVVAEVGTADLDVVPGATDRALAFTVTNASNATIDVALSTLLDLATGPRGDAANFTATNVRIYLDNGNGTFSLAGNEDVAVTRLDGLLPTADGNPTQGIKTIFVVADIPAGLNNGDAEVVTLTAEARQFDNNNATLGAAFSNDSAIADDPATVQNVFADGDGPATGDADRDGRHSDDDTYQVVITALNVAKSVSTISHTIGADTVTTNPKAIPGAVMEYCILLTNSGAQAATSVALTDTLPSEVTYEPNTMLTGANCAGAATAEDDDNSDGGDADGFTANVTAGVLTGAVTQVNAGATAAIKFRVKVK